MLQYFQVQVKPTLESVEEIIHKDAGCPSILISRNKRGGVNAMISILGLLAAFGGGVFAVCIGPLPAFILTGVFSVAGSVAGMCGAADASNILLNYVAFGPFFGPHIAFAGGAAAAAFAKKKGISENGADIATAMAGYNEPSLLLVGGIFGMLGYLFKELVVVNLFAGSISPRLVTDGPGFTVFCSAVLARLLFGGKLRTGTEAISKGKTLGTTLFIGFAYSLLVGSVYAGAIYAGVPVEAFGGAYPTLIFGIAAIGLIFAEFGQPYFGCHHTVIIAASAAVQSYAATDNVYMAVAMAVVFGFVATLIGDIAGKLINSGTDSHIDPPATAILIMTFAVNAIFPV